MVIWWEPFTSLSGATAISSTETPALRKISTTIKHSISSVPSAKNASTFFIETPFNAFCISLQSLLSLQSLYDILQTKSDNTHTHTFIGSIESALSLQGVHYSEFLRNTLKDQQIKAYFDEVTFGVASKNTEFTVKSKNNRAEIEINNKNLSTHNLSIVGHDNEDVVVAIQGQLLVNGVKTLTIDDEGVPSQCNVLIKDGILQGYMQDKLNARLMGVKPTGNGRRESYAHLPMPRMTNTYMLAGQSKFDDLIASVDRGIYAPHFGGGQVDITSGKFVFSTSEAYLIEKGKITKPVKGATLIGSGIDVMQKVSMVADETDLDLGIGVCGKDGQSVPVGVGQPALKIDEITVGGTN